jgi:hypothetical protein
MFGDSELKPVLEGTKARGASSFSSATPLLHGQLQIETTAHAKHLVNLMERCNCEGYLWFQRRGVRRV